MALALPYWKILRGLSRADTLIQPKVQRLMARPKSTKQKEEAEMHMTAKRRSDQKVVKHVNTTKAMCVCFFFVFYNEIHDVNIMYCILYMIYIYIHL